MRGGLTIKKYEQWEAPFQNYKKLYDLWFRNQMQDIHKKFNNSSQLMKKLKKWPKKPRKKYLKRKKE